ncbi:MAG: hypothetical protein KAW87_07780 [Candidatus Cloacimonetes bacterium]|nr:hypothetical protein [Candidatus Cloacimonadota bacterium]
MNVLERLLILITILFLSCIESTYLKSQKSISEDEFKLTIEPPVAKIFPDTLQIHGVELIDYIVMF